MQYLVSVIERRETYCWRGDVDDPGWSRLYETIKAVDVLNCFTLEIDSSEGKKSVVWVEPMMCVLGNPIFLGNCPYCWKKSFSNWVNNLYSFYSRYPQDFGKREGGYHRGDSYNKHHGGGYHRRGGDWHHRPPKHHGPYGSYPHPPHPSHYPPPHNMYGSMRGPPPPYGNHHWVRGPHEGERKKDPRHHHESPRRDRFWFYSVI